MFPTGLAVFRFLTALVPVIRQRLLNSGFYGSVAIAFIRDSGVLGFESSPSLRCPWQHSSLSVYTCKRHASEF
jgi:hypothetical protein